jgi:GTP-binding protein Era
MGERDNGKLFDVIATLHVERDSQKGIIIGPQGSKLKAIGTTARKSIENLIGMQVFLQIHVKVSKEWQKDPKMLARLGFTE